MKRYDGHSYISLGRRREPQSAFSDGAGWAVAVCVVQFLDKVVDVSVVVLVLLVGTVQLFDKAADVPVVVSTVRLRSLLPGRALQRFVEQIIDMDG